MDFDTHLFYRAQIAFLKTAKTSTFITAKYIDFIYIFSLDLVAKLTEYTKINDHAGKLTDGK